MLLETESCAKRHVGITTRGSLHINTQSLLGISADCYCRFLILHLFGIENKKTEKQLSGN
jgi:hypothetical protein